MLQEQLKEAIGADQFTDTMSGFLAIVLHSSRYQICLCNYKCKFNLFCCQPYNLATKGHRTSVRFKNSLELTSPYFLRCVSGENINKNMHVALIIRF